MFPELHRAKVQRPVLAVEKVNVLVKVFHIDRVHGHGVFDHRLPVFTLLQFFYAINEAFPYIFLSDRDRENIQLICQQFPQFSNLQTTGICLPDGAVIDIPHFPLRIIPGNRLKIIRKSVADADLIFTIARIGMRLHIFNGQRDP